MNDPTVFRARWVLPVTAPPIPNGAVTVDGNGRIAAVGPASRVASPAASRTVDLGDAVLLPGLVNAHTHLDLSFLRGLLDDLDFTDWIAALLAAKRTAGLGEAEYLVAARWSTVESLAAGITTVGSTEDTAAGMLALRESGQRGVVYREVFGPAPDQCHDAVTRLEERVATMREMETDLVRVGVSPHAPYSVSDALFRATVRLARERELPMAVHTAESMAELEFVAAGRGVFADRLRARGIGVEPRARSTVALLDGLGVLAARPLLIHCVNVDESDVARIAAAGASVVHCPAANARLGHGIAPVDAFLSAGVTVALGSDSVASNNRVDMLEEARSAQILRRARDRSPRALPADRLLRMVTLDGARALGLADRTGSLEVGKDADLCGISLAGPHVAPVNDPLAAIFHAARAADVTLTAVRGRVLYRDGRFTALDVAPARTAVESLAERVREALHSQGILRGPAPL